MPNSSASHNGNLVSFDELITGVKGFGGNYNPANVLLKIPALEAKSTAAHNAMSKMNTIEMVYRVDVERRTVIYQPVNWIVTRIFNFIKSSGASQVIIDQVATNIGKLKGKRAGKKLLPPAEGELKEVPQQISVSQMGFDDRLNNFDKLIRQLELIPEYQPNENDLNTKALRDLWNKMDHANKAVLNSETDLSNARIARNIEFYTKGTGLTEIGRADKLYIKAAFGSKSPQYLQVAKLRFRTYAN